MLTIISLSVIFFLCYIFYARTRSRLRSSKIPPGPIGLPFLGYLPFLGDAPALKVTELSKKYGNLFTLKLGQQLVLFVNDVENMKEMSRNDNFLGRIQLDIMKGNRQSYGLSYLEREGWAEWRRFTIKTLKQVGFGQITLENLILDQVEEFRNFLSANQNTPLYLQESIEIAALNALWEILTGEKYELEDPEKKEIMKTIHSGITDQTLLGIVVFLPWLGKLFPKRTGYGNALKCLEGPIQMGQNIIEKHINKYSQGCESDFIDLALTKIYATTDAKSHFYKEVGLKNLLYTVLDLFFTGSDAISAILGWAFLLVATYPEVQRKIQAEIDDVIGRFILPAIPDRGKMVYTEAVMMEVQRLCTISPLGIMHSSLEESEYKGFRIPKRTAILWNYYHVHHDPEYWGDPDVFRPERFMNADESLRKDDHLLPFFTGKRSCPGESLATNEYFLFLVGVLQKFRVELVDENVQIDFLPKSAFVVRPPSFNLKVVGRTD